MTTPRDPRYAGYRYPAEVIATAVWLYFRFPLSLRMVEEMLAARGIVVSHETVRQWGLKFGREIADRLRRRAPRRGDMWHLDEVVLTIAGTKPCHVATYVKSATHKAFGRDAWNWRFSRSAGHGAARSPIMVRTAVPRVAPFRPI